MILSDAGFVWKAVRGIFGILDEIIYSLFGMLIRAYFQLSEISFVGPAINSLKARVYIFITIFMIFRVAISLLQAMVNPDVANDKKAGVGTVVSRVAISLMLLVAVPVLMDNILFGETNGKSHQQIIASIVPRLILGGSANDAMSNPEIQSNVGQHIASAAYTAFFTIDEDCGEGEEFKLTNMKVSSIGNHVNDTCESEHKSKYFKYNYSWGFSTVCGVIMVAMIIGYSLDLVSRMIKLQILEILAPIPIVAYVDPGKGKDNLFSTWLKTLISTYCEFFIKLATLYFVIFIMVSFIQNKDAMIPDEVGLLEIGYMTVIVIIGLLLALQQLPQFISTIFGIKYESMGAGLSTLLGAAAGFATGGLAGALAGGSAGMADGGKSGALGMVNKGKDAGKKTDTGKQREMNRQQKKDDALRKRYGLDENKKAREDELNTANSELADAQNEYDLAQSALAASSKKDRAAAEQRVQDAYDKLTKAKNHQAVAQKRYDKAKKYADDPHKAIAEGHATTRLGAFARYHARQIGNEAKSNISDMGNNVKEWYSGTKLGDFTAKVAEDFSDSEIGRGISDIVNQSEAASKERKETIDAAVGSKIGTGKTEKTDYYRPEGWRKDK